MRRAPAAVLTLGLLGGLGFGLGGCQHIQPGLSGVDAEQARRQGEFGFSVLSNKPERTVFMARGKQVVIAPAEGFCVAPESLDVSGKAAFALVSDCETNAGARPFPGIVTVSVAGTPLAPPGKARAAALDELRQFVITPEGMSLLGRSASGGSVSVVEMREIGGGLFVLVEDKAAAPLPLLNQRFWRAFVEIAGRLTMVTVSAFNGPDVPEETMLAFLAGQVVALKRANSQPASKEELDLVAAVEGEFIAAGGARPSATVYAAADDEGSGDGSGDEADLELVGQGIADLSDGGIVIIEGGRD